MSVQETYSVTISGSGDGLAIASRLASRTEARLRWVAGWTSPPPGADDSGLEMECLPSPTLDEVRKLVARTASAPVGNQHVLCIHWSPRLYAADEGPEGRWVSFVDPDGKHRDDARVYAIELARNAVPLTTLGDRPWNTELEFGPAPATGWALRLGVMRDHMPEAILIDWFAEVMSVPVGAIARAARPAFTRRP